MGRNDTSTNLRCTSQALTPGTPPSTETASCTWNILHRSSGNLKKLSSREDPDQVPGWPGCLQADPYQSWSLTHPLRCVCQCFKFPKEFPHIIGFQRTLTISGSGLHIGEFKHWNDQPKHNQRRPVGCDESSDQWTMEVLNKRPKKKKRQKSGEKIVASPFNFFAGLHDSYLQFPKFHCLGRRLLSPHLSSHSSGSTDCWRTELEVKGATEHSA